MPSFDPKIYAPSEPPINPIPPSERAAAVSWEEKPATLAQRAYLGARLELPALLLRGEASALISKLKREEALNPPLELKQRVEELFNAGYLQTSRKYRSVARLPKGKTGIEALIEAELANIRLPSSHPSYAYWQAHYPKWATGMGELHAAKHYRSCHAGRAGLSRDLDAATFEALLAYTKAQGVDFSWGKLK